MERGVDIPTSRVHRIYRGSKHNMTIGGFFTFQFMISSMLIEIVYAFGAIGITVGCVILMTKKQLLLGIVFIIVGNLIWRLVCETAIIFFRINEQLGMINQELKRNVK